jgi:hypothetical protein
MNPDPVREDDLHLDQLVAEQAARTAGYLGPKTRPGGEVKLCGTAGCEQAYQSWKVHRETGQHKAAVRAERQLRRGDTALAKAQREGLL